MKKYKRSFLLFLLMLLFVLLTACESGETTATAPCNHVFGAWEVSYPASDCTLEGERTRTCSLCRTVERETVPARGHEFGDWETVTPATCTTDGERVRICVHCFTKISESVTGQHDYKDGVCTLCKQPCLHSFEDWIVTQPAGCTADGEKVRICTDCFTKETAVIPAGHSFGTWETVTPASCGLEGLRRHTCSVCKAVEDEVLPAGTHNYGDWTEVTPPACVIPGLRQKTCSVCGDVQKEEIPATGHSFANGVCSVCGEKESEHSVGLLLTLNTDGKSYNISGMGTCKDTALILPSAYNGKPVTGIDPMAFANTPIQSVVIPASITDLGLACFNGCTSLTRITLSNGITELSSCWLLSATGVKTFVIPAGVTRIGGGFFYNSKVTELRFEGTVAEWRAIEKEAHWELPLSTKTVICSDGSVSVG